MSLHLVLHSVAVKKQANVAAIASFCGMNERVVAEILEAAVKSDRVLESKGRYALLPLAQVALEAQYEQLYISLRDSSWFKDVCQEFERLNGELKAVITDWQTVPLGGTRIANDHTDEDYDAAVINRLERIHERVQPVLQRLRREIPRFAYYESGLAGAMDHVEESASAWVSGAEIPSYHTLWFELHEDLLRLGGKRRVE
jgi:hypothetical protein